jgi:hypothetical protein
MGDENSYLIAYDYNDTIAGEAVRGQKFAGQNERGVASVSFTLLGMACLAARRRGQGGR